MKNAKASTIGLLVYTEFYWSLRLVIRVIMPPIYRKSRTNKVGPKKKRLAVLYVNRDITVIHTRLKAATLNAFDIKAPRHGWHTTNMYNVVRPVAATLLQQWHSLLLMTKMDKIETTKMLLQQAEALDGEFFYLFNAPYHIFLKDVFILHIITCLNQLYLFIIALSPSFYNLNIVWMN